MKKLFLGLAALIAITFVACDEDPNTYIIEFDSNGGTSIEAQTIEEGDTIIKPTDPTKDGFIFDFWTLDGQEYNFSTPVNSQFNLLASWAKEVIVVDFEDVSLNADGLNQNDTVSGSITSGGLSVSTTWTTSTWGSYNSGFVVSNQTDTTTAGYTNPYSCFAGEGANGSSNYAVYYKSSDSVKFDVAVDLVDIMVCNNTYTGLSMTNGDAYAKKFESGDYFKLFIKPHNAAGEKLGTEEVYLANFQDGNSFILNEWTRVDLSTYKDVSYIKFGFESSDNGDWGPNTPLYFCLDNIAYYEAE